MIYCINYLCPFSYFLFLISFFFFFFCNQIIGEIGHFNKLFYDKVPLNFPDDVSSIKFRVDSAIVNLEVGFGYLNTEHFQILHTLLQ